MTQTLVTFETERDAKSLKEVADKNPDLQAMFPASFYPGSNRRLIIIGDRDILRKELRAPNFGSWHLGPLEDLHKEPELQEWP